MFQLTVLKMTSGLMEFHGIQEIAVFKIQRLRLPAVSGKLLRQRLAQKAVSAKNESDRSTHGFSP